jgi:hypothetical protein
MMDQSIERPIFIIGMQRSGTTMLRYMLCAHSRIYIPPESNFFPRFYQHKVNEPISQQQAVQAVEVIKTYRPFFKDWQGKKLDPENFVAQLADLSIPTILSTLYRQYAAQYGAARWGDKTPIYISSMDKIAEFFPTAQFIHIIRDGRDVALSMRKAYQHARFFYMDIYYSARSWKRRLRKAFASGKRLREDRYYEIRYEDLVEQPEKSLRALCAFIGESYEPAMAEPHKEAVKHHHSKGIHEKTRQQPTTGSVGKWQKLMSIPDQKIFQRAAGDLLEELGYHTVNLGSLSLAEKLRYTGLQTKFTVIDAGREVIQLTGISNPTLVLANTKKDRLKQVKPHF